MESRVIKSEKNPFLGRDEIVLEIKADVAPSFNDIKKSIGKNEDLIVIKRINSNFGRKVFSAEVVVYDNKKMKETVEVIPKKVRKKMKEEEKAKKDAEKKAKEEKKKAEETKSETVEKTE